MIPIPIDFLTQETPSLTPHTSKSDKWLQSYDQKCLKVIILNLDFTKPSNPKSQIPYNVRLVASWQKLRPLSEVKLGPRNPLPTSKASFHAF